jgi:hypothetical protein
MTRLQFQEKYDEFRTPNADNVLMRIASNLSDLHIEKDFFTAEQMDAKLNNLKRYIFDFQDVLRNENKK